MNDPIVVEAVRSGVTESVHLVDVAVVDASGELVASAGEPLRHAAFRSSAKPIQARAAREAGWAPPSDAALAIACASHSGSPEHIEAVRMVLRAAGLDESALRCPPALPLDPADVRAVAGEASILHNCSGKHAAMLAACVEAGWDLEGYREPAHPLQQRIAAGMRELLGRIPDPLVDGCGVPTWVAPLAALARAFASIDDEGPETAAMRAHPVLVGGHRRVDTELMQTLPGLVAKGGAEALLCMALDGTGIALKVRDGGARGVGPAAVLVLEALGHDARGVLDQVRNPVVLGGGEPVGMVRARGTLRR